jgi:hypothetical protein
MTAPARPSLLSRMTSLFAAQARAYCLSALIAGLLGIASLTALLLFTTHDAGKVGFDPVALWRSMTFSRQLTWIFGLLFALWTPILLAARGVCHITTKQLAGQPIALGRVLGDMARFTPAGLIYALVIGIPMLIGSSILIVPGIVVVSMFVLVVPTSVNESLGILATLRRGVSLGARVGGKAILLTFASSALAVLVFLIRVILLDPFLPSANSSPFGVGFAIRVALAYIPALLALILANICFTLLYLEAREAETPASPSPAASGAVGS